MKLVVRYNTAKSSYEILKAGCSGSADTLFFSISHDELERKPDPQEYLGSLINKAVRALVFENGTDYRE
ncbi:MAG: hypothetical protein A2487_00805 [Candidatus Raymondbacteria bacterium RifOxyC12_full_50_8]|uniref:Uncharacterized protein n=1 Tax=Candidatus Raymondbacteria bacterium RIFOXYD12_FULL_49_13 TaxID=1817890 RepID=A0A1F7F9S8_UNCRA|nr:MAG: hypothetical protein A2350_03280 [Candidatus Raymondbacteria bacterium RifOxyB12_full_50_8]OGJ93266.1 MAG: hypothetical protein A2248_18025 [Candidatus Raymondbacteria bacterium RIFOXYA2_FULL_49_16]OGJ98171.1 MAG: hypothetical protein A2487_00805 [Candidatus Raymondbacteria bacterium RifOxyC12_full_50_8]OGK03348.1 MAG: hypothetical protein A2519_15370 [Candidatus Raymondbacteria bacterium RIFOXYD12_FULL_49_13]OGP44988.1 MAG: hypothetical protein A2324_19950 [Candidatus Raymondbacteria b